jgi:NADP-reducing hydrogenase subunit HndB
MIYAKLRDQKQKAIEETRPLQQGRADHRRLWGNCGIAAGAKRRSTRSSDELDAKGISHVLVRQTGCMGLCHSEPTVEVIVPNMPVVIYGNVNAEVGKQIVTTTSSTSTSFENHIATNRQMDIVR